MKPGTNPFDPFGLMAGGPLAAWHMGWKMIEAWQRAWMPLMKVMQNGLSGQALPLFAAPPVLAFPNPMAGLVPQIEALLTPIRGKAGEDDAARLSMRVRLPAMPGTGGAEQLSVEALIARQQGRETPWLGCLQGANVVYPTAEDVVGGERDAIDAEPASATRKAVKAVRAAPAKSTAGKVAAPRKAAKPRSTGK